MHALCCLSPLVTEAEIWIFPAKLVSGNCSTSTPQAGLTAVASAGFWKTETQSQVCGNARPWLWSRFGPVRSQAEKHRQEERSGSRGAPGHVAAWQSCTTTRGDSLPASKLPRWH